MHSDIELPASAHRSMLAYLRVGVLASAVAMTPFHRLAVITLDEHSPHLEAPLLKAPYLGILDLVLGLTIIVAIVSAVVGQRPRRLGIGQVGLATLASAAVVHILFDPSLGGAVLSVRLIGIAALVYLVSLLSAKEWMIAMAWPFAIVSLVQGVLALAQTLVFDSGVLPPGAFIGDGPVWTVGTGTFLGPYTMATFLILSLTVVLSSHRFRPLSPILWASVAISAAAVATTFGRTGAVALAFVVVVYVGAAVWDRRAELALSGLVVAGSFAAVAVIVRSSWLARAAQTVEGVASSRGALMARALDVIGANPWFGTGPAQYGPALAELGLQSTDYAIVHNVPLLITAEFGIPLGILFGAWLVALGIGSFMTSARVGAVFVAIIPYFMLDNLHYVFTIGVMMIGLWVATLDFHRLVATTDTDRHHPAPSPHR